MRYRLHLLDHDGRPGRCLEFDLPSDEEAIIAVERHISGPPMLLCGEDDRVVASFGPGPTRPGPAELVA